MREPIDIDWPTNPTDIIHEALREYVGDGDGTDEAVLAAHDAKVRTEVAQAVEEVLGRWCLGTPVQQMIVAEVRGAMFRADAVLALLPGESNE